MTCLTAATFGIARRPPTRPRRTVARRIHALGEDTDAALPLSAAFVRKPPIADIAEP
jgi:hypothetical protein